MEEKIWHKFKWPKGVPRSIDYPRIPLHKILEDAARIYPNNTYTIFQGAKIRFKEADRKTDQVADFLIRKGIEKGDRVAIFLPNLPHYPIIFFGILKAGAVCVTCNPMYTESELHFQLKDSGAVAAFVMDHPEFYRTASRAIRDTSVNTVIYCSVKSFLPPLKGLLGGLLGKIPGAKDHSPEHIPFDRVLAGGPKPRSTIEIDPAEDLALILYTGGTTGVPKGACLTHFNLISNLIAVDEYVRIEEEPGAGAEKLARGGRHCFLGVLPWYHSYGLTLTMLWSCYTGSRLVCVPDPRAGNPPFTEVLELIQRYRCTIVNALPRIYSAIIDHPKVKEFDLSSIMGCGSGAAPLPVALAKQFEEKTGAVIFEGYGLTETSPVTHLNPTNREDRKFGSVGLPLPDTDVKILDAETGTRELPVGKDGEIAVSGPQVMKGYWNKPKENELVFRQIGGKRFFLTGDIGHLDDEGFTVITDRKKDMIDVGGLKAYPREIEEVLYSHPKVLNAAVVGVPDRRTGEAVKAFVQLKKGEIATEEEIIDFCRSRLAGYKRPRSVEFREELPVTAVGKILRRKLREEALAKETNQWKTEPAP